MLQISTLIPTLVNVFVLNSVAALTSQFHSFYFTDNDKARVSEKEWLLSPCR